MERRHQLAMLASIVHIVTGDWSSLVHALTEMDVIRPGTNLRRVTMVRRPAFESTCMFGSMMADVLTSNGVN